MGRLHSKVPVVTHTMIQVATWDREKGMMALVRKGEMEREKNTLRKRQTEAEERKTEEKYGKVRYMKIGEKNKLLKERKRLKM